MSKQSGTPWSGRKRRHRCQRTGCAKYAVKRGSFCSRSCARTSYLLTKLTPEQRSAQMRKAIALKHQQAINRMVQRVQALAEGEEARIVLAWRYGKQAKNVARYRQRRAAQPPSVDAVDPVEGIVTG